MTEIDAFVWMMAFVRTGGLFALLPVFSGHIPVVIRIALAAFLSWVVASTLHPQVVLPTNLGGLAVAMFHELVIGLLMGMGTRLVYFAVEMAGALISTELGLSLGTQLDPLSLTSPSAIGLAIMQASTLLFILSGTHHYVFAAFVRSFELSPPGALGFNANAGKFLSERPAISSSLAVQISAPVMAVNFVVTLTFAILGKAAPSMNVFSESFAARILVGLTVLGLTVGVTAQLVLTELRRTPELMLRLIP